MFNRPDLCDTLKYYVEGGSVDTYKSTVSKSNLDNKRKLEVGAHT